jgi:hypothetical protein
MSHTNGNISNRERESNYGHAESAGRFLRRSSRFRATAR